MADWTDLPNSLFETGKPARGTDMRAMRDNMIAIAEGSELAPRISWRAVNLNLARGITEPTIINNVNSSSFLVSGQITTGGLGTGSLDASLWMYVSDDGTWSNANRIQLARAVRSTGASGGVTDRITDSFVMFPDIDVSSIRFMTTGSGSISFSINVAAVGAVQV